MKKKYNILILILFLLLLPIMVQAKELVKDFDFEMDNYTLENMYLPVNFIKISDGYLSNVIITSDGKTDSIITKYNNEGKKIWDKKWGGNDDDLLLSIIEVEDGYVAVGSFRSTDIPGLTYDSYNVNDAAIVKFDKDGNVLWQKSYSEGDYCQFNSVIEVDDGYITAGNGLRKYSKENGTILFEKSQNYFGEENYLIELEDGYALISSRESDIFVKTDKNGNIIINTREAGTLDIGVIYKMIKTKDGFMVIAEEGKIYLLNSDGTENKLIYDLTTELPNDFYLIGGPMFGISMEQTKKGYIFSLFVGDDNTSTYKPLILEFDEDYEFVSSKFLATDLYPVSIINDTDLVYLKAASNLPGAFSEDVSTLSDVSNLSLYVYGEREVLPETTTTTKIDNPPTKDNMLFNIILGGISVITLSGLYINRKKAKL